jgi:hypothetical protein
MSVPKNIRKHAPHLHIIGTGKKTMRDAIIATADKKLIDAICECCKNSLHGNINHSEKDKRRLRQYKRWIKLVMNKKVGIKTKKRILRQKGGFLPMVLGPLLGLGGKLLSSAIGGILGNLMPK